MKVEGSEVSKPGVQTWRKLPEGLTSREELLTAS